MLTGDNGILQTATKSKDETIVSQEKEQIEIAYVSVAINKLGKDVTETDLQVELDKVAKTFVTDNGDDTLSVLFDDTKHNYNVDNGKVEKEVPITNPYENEDWIMAWTCTNGTWSDTINAGEKAEGDIIAKLYKTGHKIKPDGFTWSDTGQTFTFNEGDEYKLVIEGKGEMGALISAEGTDIKAAFAWQLPTVMYMMGASNTCIIPYISEIIICDGVTNIGSYAFCGDTSLNKLTLTNSIETIGEYSFFYNINLFNIKLPTSLTTIERHAFSNCSKLESITIPYNVTIIGELPFYDCNTLSKIKILTTKLTNSSVDFSAFYYISKNSVIYVINENMKNIIERLILPEGTIVQVLP